MKIPFLLSIFSAIATLSPVRPATAQALPNLPVQINPNALHSLDQYRGRRRAICATDDVPLTALAYATADETTGSLTTQAQPTLWFYLPTELSEAAITIRSTNNQLLYEGRLVGDTEGEGIVSVPLPVELAMGEAYQWVLTFECQDSEQVTVDGWVSRGAIASARRATFEVVGDRNRAALYANAGFLQDALSELATLRLADKENEELAQDWVSFLSDLGLADLTAAPLLDCCQIADAQNLPAEVEEPEVSEPEVSEPIEDPVEPEVEAEPTEEPDTRTPLQRARDRG